MEKVYEYSGAKVYYQAPCVEDGIMILAEVAESNLKSDDSKSYEYKALASVAKIIRVARPFINKIVFEGVEYGRDLLAFEKKLSPVITNFAVFLIGEVSPSEEKKSESNEPVA